MYGCWVCEVATDSKLVADDAMSVKDIDNFEFGTTIASCHLMCDKCDRIHVKYIGREANILIHCLAIRSLDYFNAYIWNEP